MNEIFEAKTYLKCLGFYIFLAILVILSGCMESIAPKKELEAKASFPTFQGCVSGQGIDTEKIYLEYEIPDWSQEFYIYRDGTQVYSTKEQEETTFIDSDLVEGHTYAYECKALYVYTDKRNDEQEEILAGQNRLKVTTKAKNMPNFSGITSVTILSPSSALVKWASPVGTGGSEVKSYKVYSKMGNSLDMNAVDPIKTTTQTTFSATISNLGDDLPYTFGVRACTVEDICTDNINTITKTTTDAGAPTTPGATAIKMDNGKVILTAPWSEINGGVYKRNVYRSKTGGTNIANYSKIFSEIVGDPGTIPNTTLIDPSPEENTTYYYIIRDEDSHEKENSNTSIMQIATGDMTPPTFAGIETYTYVDPEDTSVQLDWTAIDPTDAAKYVIYATSAKGNATDPLPNPENPCTTGLAVRDVTASLYNTGDPVHYKLTGLLPRVTYGICVKAWDAAENVSKTTVYKEITTHDITPPEFDGVQSVTYGSKIDVRFNKSLSSDLKEYKILIWKNSLNPAAGDITTLTRLPSELTAVSSTQYSFKFDKSDFTYNDYDNMYVVVKACDNASPNFGTQNCSPYPSTYPSDKTKLLALGDTTKPTFTGLASIERGSPADKNITLKWTAISSQPLDPEGATSYLVYQTVADGTTTPANPCELADTNTTVTFLAKNYTTGDTTANYSLAGHVERKTYALCMKAQDAAGNISTTSTWKKVTMYDITPPSFAGPKLAQYNNGNIVITWDSSPSSDILEYKTIVWKNSLTPTGEVTIIKQHATNPTGFTLTTTDFPYGSGDTVYVMTNACDNTSGEFGTKNCTDLALTYKKSVTLADTIPPTFNGITTAILKAPKDQNATITWTAIYDEATKPTLGADEYVIYKTSAPEMGTPNNPCDSASADRVEVGRVAANLYAYDATVTYDISELDQRTTYLFCVKAKDSHDNYSNTNVKMGVRTLDLTPPSFAGVDGLTYTSATAKLNASWPETYGVNTYKVKIWKGTATPAAGDITTKEISAATYPTGYSFDSSVFSFTDGDKVYVLVDACDDAYPNFVDTGVTVNNCTSKDYSTAANKLLDDLTPPNATFGGIANVTNIAGQEGAITVTWSVNTSDWSDYSGFKIYHVNSDNSLQLLKDCKCTATVCTNNEMISCNVTGLDHKRKYKIHVRAYDPSPNKNETTTSVALSMNITTLDLTVPTFSSPNSSILASIGSGAISVSWHGATDNQWSSTDYLNTVANTITYKLYRRASAFTDATNPTGNADAVLAQSSTATSYSISLLDASLVEGTTYYFTVCAVDVAGNKKCDGNTYSAQVKDKTAPVIGTVSIINRTIVSSALDTWELSYTVTDNSTSNGMLVTADQIPIQIYRKFADTAVDFPPENVSYLIENANASLNLLTGEGNVDNSDNKNYINYFIVATDTVGLKTTKQVSFLNSPCSTDWVLVPANPAVGTTSAFCVMKYEAKNVGGVATSQASSTPWVSITPTAAYTACLNLGAGYHLIGNTEWMTIARNIQNVASNWSSGVIGTGMIPRGHSDQSAIALAVTNTADPYNGTDNNSSQALDAGWEQKRTLALSNGEILWDFSGNVFEFIDWSLADVGLTTMNPGCLTTDTKELNAVIDCSNLLPSQYIPSPVYISTNGFGYLQTTKNTNVVAMRSWWYGFSVFAGLYSLTFTSLTDYQSHEGFRCAYKL